MQLEKALEQKQIDAWEHWPDWESEKIARLQQDFPKPEDAIHEKTYALNNEYDTHIDGTRYDGTKYEVAKVFESMEQALKGTSATGPDLVEELVQAIRPVTQQRNYVYVAKIRAFFY